MNDFIFKVPRHYKKKHHQLSIELPSSELAEGLLILATRRKAECTIVVSDAGANLVI